MIIENFKPFAGQHCETTATGSLLNHAGIELSEPMLFGLGEGLGFVFWNMKAMDFPFIGGRIRQNILTRNIASHLGLTLSFHETASVKKAWEHVKDMIDHNVAVGLQLDCYYLEYFSSKIHFAAHYVAMYGYDDEYAYLVDTLQQGKNTRTSLKNLALARSEKGPMASKNISYTIRKEGKVCEPVDAIVSAIRNNARDFLNPPISNIGYKGIMKASKGISHWFRNSTNVENEFLTTARLMEKGGTGGALFRNLYRDFLMESHDLLGLAKLDEGYEMFSEIAVLWTQVSGLFEKAAKTKDIQYIHEAAEILTGLSRKEKTAMELLLSLE